MDSIRAAALGRGSYGVWELGWRASRASMDASPAPIVGSNRSLSWKRARNIWKVLWRPQWQMQSIFETTMSRYEKYKRYAAG